MLLVRGNIGLFQKGLDITANAAYRSFSSWAILFVISCFRSLFFSLSEMLFRVISKLLSVKISSFTAKCLPPLLILFWYTGMLVVFGFTGVFFCKNSFSSLKSGCSRSFSTLNVGSSRIMFKYWIKCVLAYIFSRLAGENGNSLVGIVEVTKKFLLFHVDLLVALF